MKKIIKDLENESSKMQENSKNLNKYIDQSKKIDSLERENRALHSEIEFFKQVENINLNLNSNGNEIYSL